MGKVNWEKIKSVYIIGIKGSGVVAIAQILNSLGISVTGSDTTEKFFTDQILQKEGIKYFEGFSETNLPENVDLIIYSTSYNEGNNVEFRMVKELGLPMKSYPEILAQLFNEKFGIAVCGTHGKTTTSAMLAYALEKCGIGTDAVIGGRVKEWGTSARVNKGNKYFVIEADEYQNKLKMYEPKAGILTSVSMDHPDFYPSFVEYRQAFEDFIIKIPADGFLLACGDNENVNAVASLAQCEVIKYGFDGDNDIQISEWTSLSQGENGDGLLQKFNLFHVDKNLGEFRLRLPGRHNAQNAGAVIGICLKLGAELEKIKQALENFQGTTRRFEYIGKRNEATLIDDYGHHPEEIVATLDAIRGAYPGKQVWAVFHPHSFSRTEAMLQEFSESFGEADKVIILDIYGSARETSGKVNSKDLVDLINKETPGKAEYIPTIGGAVEFLQDKIGEGDLVLSIGAGNVFEVVEALKEKHD